MNIKRSIWIDQGRVEITMFDPVATTTVKVTGSTGSPAAGADMECDFFEIDRFENFFAKFLFLIRRMAAACREFFIGAGRIVADQAIDIFFRGKVKRIIFPVISSMTAGAPAPV